MKLRFSARYLALALLIFALEVVIATALRHVSWVRAYLGDVLVVVLVFALVRSVVAPRQPKRLVLGVFLFALGVEVLQAFKMADRLGFAPGSLPYVLLGNTFSWLDILCYALGCLLILFVPTLWRLWRPST